MRASAAAHFGGGRGGGSPSGGVSWQNAPAGRNSGEFGTEKRTIALSKQAGSGLILYLPLARLKVP
ncbi:hypothetical protein CIT25_19675 [Mesorhizobium mediterraneum]|uniref:Uncharacterized protein n=1 Tax=Mesorhizobium mediterraneum TaxID=43617 RepID=A0AB36R7W0_9HYPH|nr:hypothetical protein CIT25_19675 [Mesorhizobium mediterraneum]